MRHGLRISVKFLPLKAPEVHRLPQSCHSISVGVVSVTRERCSATVRPGTGLLL